MVLKWACIGLWELKEPSLFFNCMCSCCLEREKEERLEECGGNEGWCLFRFLGGGEIGLVVGERIRWE